MTKEKRNGRTQRGKENEANKKRKRKREKRKRKKEGRGRRKKERKKKIKRARRVGCVEEYRAQTPGNDRAGRPPGQLGYNITAACFTASRRVRRFGLKFLDRRDGGPWENWRVRRRWEGAGEEAKNYMNF